MRTRLLTILFIAASFSVLPMIAVAGHNDYGNYNWPDRYARIAIKQVEKSDRRGCHFRGSRWTRSYNDHRRWAARNPVRAGEREIRRRDEMLRNCRGRYGNSYGGYNKWSNYGHDSQAAFADYYASTAVKQARRNIRQGCGYYGERWTTDYNRHYRYGHKTRRYRAESEIQVRERMLNECRGQGRRH